MRDRTTARELAEQYLSNGDPTGWFEALYAQAGSDARVIPWADLAPNPNLTEWLERGRVKGVGLRALVVGCGLGDDAEALARVGFAVTAFDIAPTAIAWCRRRFAETKVDYVVADAMNPPGDWRGAFDFVLESYTLQALPEEPRRVAQGAIVELLAAEGRLLVIARAREAEEPVGQAPWPLTRREMELFEAAGLREESFEDFVDVREDPPVRRFRGVYRR